MPGTDAKPPDTNPRDLTKRHLTYRVVAMPSDTNGAGHIFGGWLMSQVDLAGSILAYEAAKGRIATRAVNEFEFLSPVMVGDLVSCYSHVVRVGRSSVEIGVDVHVERIGDPKTVHQVAKAQMTYVALTDDGEPRKISH